MSLLNELQSFRDSPPVSSDIGKHEALEAPYLADLEKALQMNQSRWCTWMNTNYQLMHNADFKAIYCERCLGVK